MLKCKLCGQTFEEKAEFGVHLRLTAKDSCPSLEGVKTCPVCKSRYKEESDLRKHLRMMLDDVEHYKFLAEET